MMVFAPAIFGLSMTLAAAAGPAPTVDDLIKVKLESGTTLRGLAEKFLNDPDLWPIILSINGIDDIADGVLEQRAEGGTARLAALRGAGLVDDLGEAGIGVGGNCR